jgi:hypothetical protein
MTRREVIEKIRGELAYALPESGKPLRYIVLTREEAEAALSPPPVYDGDRVLAGFLTALSLSEAPPGLDLREHVREHVRLLLAELVPALVAATEGMP